jgi:UDP-N-acetylmuramate: L-alanyl-gamma-D-glutamyl-meso-diaminopimelate ligase
MKTGKKIYFMGICGIAMTQAAIMLKKDGFDVFGSDEKSYPPSNRILMEEGIKIHEGYKIENLDSNPDLVVIGNALSRGNPEVEEVLNRKMDYISLPELIKNYFIGKRKSIVVSGTHGKSTITGMISHILRDNGYDPGYILGGIINNYNSGYHKGSGDYFVIEGDEYDTAFFDKRSKFLHYSPDILIINAVEYDHADIFNTIDDIILSFKRLVNILPSKGSLIINGHDDNTVFIARNSLTPIKKFGFSPNFTYSADNCIFTEDGSEFDLLEEGNFVQRVKTKLLGFHNIQNSLAALSCVLTLDIDNKSAIKSLGSFPGIKRRMDKIFENGDIKVYDDFAHHPTAVKKTIEALRMAYPEKKLIAVFEPRSNTMGKKHFENTFYSSFLQADTTIISKVHRAEKIAESSRFDPKTVCNDLKKIGKNAYYYQSTEEIKEFLLKTAGKDDIIVFMSNGNFDGLAEKFKNELGKRNLS